MDGPDSRLESFVETLRLDLARYYLGGILTEKYHCDFEHVSLINDTIFSLSDCNMIFGSSSSDISKNFQVLMMSYL